MFRSTRSSLLALAAVACMSIVTSATARIVDAYDYVVLGVVRMANFAVNLLLGVGNPATGARIDAKPTKQLHAAEQSVMRQAKRERPQIETLYRMCPST